MEGVEAENRIEHNSRTCECAGFYLGLALDPHTGGQLVEGVEAENRIEQNEVMWQSLQKNLWMY